MKKYRLHELVVPWGNGETQRIYLVGSLIAAVFISVISFWMRLDISVNSVLGTTGIYISGRTIPTVDYLFSAESGYILHAPVFFPFTLLAAAMVVLILLNYAGFRRETKSIYLMRRLPDRWELHRRCLTLPVLTLLACGVLVVALTWVCWQLYLNVPPAAAIPPDNREVAQLFWDNIRQTICPPFSYDS